MKLDLENRVVLVTGGSKGIGRAIAEELLEEGASVSICARNLQPLKELSKKANSLKKNYLLLELDIHTKAGAKLFIQKSIEKFGSFDVLAHNAAGASGRGKFLEISEQDWENTFSNNVITLVRLIKLSYKLLSNSDQARIIAIASNTATEPGSHDPHYSASKSALLNLAKHLSNELAPKGIIVNSISPGPVETDSLIKFVEELSKKSTIEKQEFKDSYLKMMQSRRPLGRIGLSEEVAALVLFLASSRASWITGSNFRIDGGKNRGF